MTEKLTSRQQVILEELIKEYVKTAEPISSAFLMEKCGLDCSPATIRAEMLNLEKGGYLRQPHTSAGRVPTDKAYRCFVNELLQEKKQDLPWRDQQKINQQIAALPREPHALSAGLAKAISRLTDDLVISGIAETGAYFRLGFSHLLDLPEFWEEDFGGLGDVFDRFDHYFNQFFQATEPEDVLIYIGRENPVRTARQETVMVTRYPLPEGYEGVSALVGPMRMAYARNLAILRYITKKMSEL